MTTPLCTPLIDYTACPVSEADAQALIHSAVDTLTQTLSPVRCFGRPYSVGIRLDTDDSVHQLNAQFRQKDKSTNVLSFPTDTDDAWDEDDQTMYLGDIIIANGVLEKEAQDADKPVAHHLQHLIIHGFLHLYGHDHIIDSEAEMMETIEIQVLKKLKIPNPYNER